MFTPHIPRHIPALSSRVLTYSTVIIATEDDTLLLATRQRRDHDLFLTPQCCCRKSFDTYGLCTRAATSLECHILLYDPGGTALVPAGARSSMLDQSSFIYESRASYRHVFIRFRVSGLSVEEYDVANRVTCFCPGTASEVHPEPTSTGAHQLQAALQNT